MVQNVWNTWSRVYLKIHPLRSRVLGQNHILNARPDNLMQIHKICIMQAAKSYRSDEDIP